MVQNLMTKRSLQSQGVFFLSKNSFYLKKPKKTLLEPTKMKGEKHLNKTILIK